MKKFSASKEIIKESGVFFDALAKAGREEIDNQILTELRGKLMTEEQYWPPFVKYIGLWWLFGFLATGALAFVHTWVATGWVVVFLLFTWWNARRLIIKYNLPTTFGISSKK